MAFPLQLNPEIVPEADSPVTAKSVATPEGNGDHIGGSID
jgi:hypothetical protein